MKKPRITLTALMLIMTLVALNYGTFVSADPPQPTYGTADVNGNSDEWNLTNDFFANMHKAGRTSKVVLSKLYLRYDCSAEVLYALVLLEPDVTFEPNASGDQHFIKIDGSKAVDADYGDDGNPPDFAFLLSGDTNAPGWEASTPLDRDDGPYKLNVHTQVVDAEGEPDQTSATTPDDEASNREIDLVIQCPEVEPKIDIEKSTNGQDADAPTGPEIPVGDTVNWAYVVTNIGNVPLTNVTVTDNQGVAVSCPKTTLAVDEPMTCTASGTAVAGQYANLGTVTGKYNSTTVNDEDPSHYFGEKPSAITLLSFTAQAGGGGGGVTLAWETATELDNAGFNLYRALLEDGPYTQINGALIAAQGDPVSGASYSFLDTPDYGTYYYQLEDVDYHGVSTTHGPVKATVARPLRRPLYRPTLPQF